VKLEIRMAGKISFFILLLRAGLIV
jgi:hypothetical protein